MFGFSLFKILLLVAVIAAVWFGFRWLEAARRERFAGRGADPLGRRGQGQRTIVDLERNPRTGAYEPRRPDGMR